MVVDATALAVGLGEIKVSRRPVEMLVAYGLGSCVGVGMYDPAARVAGLLHAPLVTLREDPTGDLERAARTLFSL